MFCPNCGKDNPEGSKFCCACGTNFLDLLKKEEPVMPKQPIINNNVVEEKPVVNNVVEEKPDLLATNNNVINEVKPNIVNTPIYDKPNDVKETKEKKKSHKGLIIILLLIAVVAVFFIIKNNKKSNKGIINGSEMVSIVRDDNGRPKFIDGTFTDVKVKSNKDAYKALNSLKSELGFKDVNKEFKVESVETSEDITYYRFHQVYKDVEVYGMNLIIAVDKDGNVLSMSGYYIPNINVSTKGGISQEEAETIAKNDLGNNAEVADTKKNIYADNNNSRLVYVIELISTEGTYEYIIDANSSEICIKSDTFDRVAYEYNSSYGKVTINHFADTTYEIYDPNRKIYISDASGYGVDPFILVSLFNNLEPAPITGTIYNGEFVYTSQSLFRPETLDMAFSSLKLFEDIYDYYKNVLGRESYDGQGSNIIVNIGLKNSSIIPGGNRFDNAMWASAPFNQFFIGYSEETDENGNTVYVPYTRYKDVLAHEYTHAVSGSIVNFASSPKEEDINKPFEPGTLNEAYSDILATLFEGNDWIMGNPDEPIRNISNPHALKNPKQKGEEYYFPDYYLNGRSVEKYISDKDEKTLFDIDFDYGGIHHNSTVVSYAAYLMYINGAFASMDEEAKVWYNSLYLLSSYSNLEDCALAVIQSAKNLGLSQDSINIIYNAFIETKMLEISEFDVTFNVASDKSKLSDVNIELKGDTNYSLTTGQNGSVKDTVRRGIYDLKVTKDSYSVYSKKVIINGETTFNIDLEKLEEDTSTNTTKTNDSKLSCKSGNCHKLTMYYLDSIGGSSIDKRFDTFMVDDGTVLGTDTILGAANSTFGSNFIKSDGGSFYVTFNGMTFDFAWYYKGTDKKFNFNTPITEDIEIEMKMFDGLIDDDFLTDIYNTFGS